MNNFLLASRHNCFSCNLLKCDSKYLEDLNLMSNLSVLRKALNSLSSEFQLLKLGTICTRKMKQIY